ncbi:MAG: OB-fold domain-containing protein [Chloroflexi bacterium]|nr:OB-fold domain-containing protein [Chloroflexota bacterium]
MTQAASQAKTAKPIVPYLQLPSKPGEKPSLMGSRCGQCRQAFVGKRVACPKCGSLEAPGEIRLSDQGKIWTFTVVYQSRPGVPTPYVAAIVDLPEGCSVKATIEGLDPSKPGPDWFDKKVVMFTEKAFTDKEGNDVVTYKFRVAQGK